MSIKNRYEFMYFVECINGNPNGDPDAGNTPRIDPQDMHGLISDVSVKRRIRNYVQLAREGEPKYNIIVQMSTNINKFIAKAHEETKGNAQKGNKLETDAAKRWICENFFDVRAFGAVLSTGANAGQVRGPVQLNFLRSVEPILPLDISITRMAVADKVSKDNATFAEIEAWEATQDEDKLRTMGRKQLIPYGLYEGRGFISANLADNSGDKKGTGFDDDDLNLLFEAILGMYDHDRSSSKGLMSTVLPLIIFRHSGTDSDSVQRERQAKLGCSPAHILFDLVKVKREESNGFSRSYKNYKLVINKSALPSGVDIGFVIPKPSGVDICWNELPDNLSWVNLI